MMDDENRALDGSPKRDRYFAIAVEERYGLDGAL